jgi:hypothetical protein
MLSENNELLLRLEDMLASAKVAERAKGRWRRRVGLGLRRPPAGEGTGMGRFTGFSIVIAARWCELTRVIYHDN